MRKLMIATVAAATLLSATAANADYYRNRGHHGGGGGGGYHHRGGTGGNWVAPLVGGLLLGGAIYGLSQPSYSAPPPYRTECRIIHQLDRWGNYVGDRQECYQVPAY